MELQVEHLDRIVMVSVDGDIDTVTAPQLQDTLNQEVAAGFTQLIVNMAAVRYVSSMGLRVFLSQLKKLKTIEGRLVLCGCNDLVQEVFRISGFASFFEMAADVATAREALSNTNHA